MKVLFERWEHIIKCERFRYSTKYFLRPIYYRMRHKYWEAFGCPYELMNHKRISIIDAARRFSCSTFVETGTYLGDTVEVCRHHFEYVYSIELSLQLYQFCVWRFRNVENVHLFLGHSGQSLHGILKGINDRVIFWLDGHYSGGSTAIGETICPLISELTAIKKHGRNDHIILIDDARLFGAHSGYPSMEEVYEALISINLSYHVEVLDDIIHALL